MNSIVLIIIIFIQFICFIFVSDLYIKSQRKYLQLKLQQFEKCVRCSINNDFINLLKLETAAWENLIYNYLYQKESNKEKIENIWKLWNVKHVEVMDRMEKGEKSSYHYKPEIFYKDLLN